MSFFLFPLCLENFFPQKLEHGKDLVINILVVFLFFELLKYTYMAAHDYFNSHPNEVIN